MLILRKLAVISMFLTGLFVSLPAQNNSGTEFWLAFTKIPWEKEDHVYVMIISEFAAKGKVEIPSMGFSKRFATRPGEMVNIELPRKVLIDTNETISNKGVHIESDKSISVYGLNNQIFGTDGFMAIPSSSLGNKYYAICYPGDMPTHILVASTENNNSISIQKFNPENQEYLKPVEIKLNKGQTFFLKSEKNEDLTGTYVYASDPVVVYSGNLGCFVPDMHYCCANHLVEQLPPLHSWGQNFITSPLALKSKGDIFKILASEPETELTINGEVVAMLERGKSYETFIPSNLSYEIKSTKPILVAQFSTSYQYDSVSFTDPFMVIIPPVEQFQDSYVFAVPGFGFDSSSYLGIMTNLENSPAFRLDNRIIGENILIDTFGFYPAVKVYPGFHTIESIYGRKFGISVYGYNSYDGFGYSGGSLFMETNCEIKQRNRISIGAAITYPLAFGGQMEFGLGNYNLLFGYLYAPEVGKLDGTKPPDSLNSDNFQHTIFISPSLVFPYSCALSFFCGPYMAFGLRYWKNLPDIIGMEPEITEVQSGNFIEFYFGIQFGLKYFLTNNIFIEPAASINIQTTHRFSDQKINGVKPGGSIFLTLNYAF